MIDLINVGLEGIGTNIDWPFKNKLEKIFADILNDLEIKTDIFDEIDKVLYERFGVRVRHYHSTVLYGCVPLGFRMDTALSKNYTEMQDRIDEITNKSELEKVIHEANDKLVGGLVKKNIEIDMAEARIHNLPKDFIVPILINLEDIHRLGIDKTYLCAILIHEIGHIFYYLSFMLYNSDGDIKQLTRDLGDKVITKHDYDNIVEKVIERDNKHDFEFIADAFATRFGYGPTLIKALKYLDDDFSGKDDKPFSWLRNALYDLLNGVGLSMVVEYILGKEVASHPLPKDRYSNIAEELRYMIKENKDTKLLNELLKDYEEVKDYDIVKGSEVVNNKILSITT